MGSYQDSFFNSINKTKKQIFLNSFFYYFHLSSKFKPNTYYFYIYLYFIIFCFVFKPHKEKVLCKYNKICVLAIWYWNCVDDKKEMIKLLKAYVKVGFFIEKRREGDWKMKSWNAKRETERERDMFEKKLNLSLVAIQMLPWYDIFDLLYQLNHLLVLQHTVSTLKVLVFFSYFVNTNYYEHMNTLTCTWFLKLFMIWVFVNLLNYFKILTKGLSFDHFLLVFKHFVTFLNFYMIIHGFNDMGLCLLSQFHLQTSKSWNKDWALIIFFQSLCDILWDSWTFTLVFLVLWLGFLLLTQFCLQISKSWKKDRTLINFVRFSNFYMIHGTYDMGFCWFIKILKKGLSFDHLLLAFMILCEILEHLHDNF